MTTPTTPGADSEANPPSNAYDRELQVARDAALAAGEILQRYFRDGGYQIDSKGKNNPVTTADFEADGELKRILRDAFPAYGWLSEETADNDDRLTARTRLDRRSAGRHQGVHQGHSGVRRRDRAGRTRRAGDGRQLQSDQG